MALYDCGPSLCTVFVLYCVIVDGLCNGVFSFFKKTLTVIGYGQPTEIITFIH
jgi:hypothetical protein